MLGSVNCLARLRRHVVLIVLGKHLIGVENSVRANVSLRHATAPFFEQVGKNSFVDYRNALGCIGDDEARCQAIVLAIQRSFFHQTTYAKGPAHWRFFGYDLRRAEKENEILLESA